MQLPVRLRNLTGALLPALALTCGLAVAAASAHGDGHGHFWHEGFRDNKAVVTGTITSMGTGSFGADAYVVSPGAGDSSTIPAATATTITIGSGTKVVTEGRAGLAVGESFYAVYRGVRDSTPLSTLAGDTPSAVYAYVAPTPEVEVKGVVTSAPASGSDSFTATTFVVAPRRSTPFGGSSDSSRGDGYSYGGKVGGAYGYRPSSSHARRTQLRSAHDLPGSTPASAGSPNTAITTDANTKVTLNAQPSSVGSLAVGDMFVAIYTGTPSEALSAITATPAISVRAWTAPAGDSLYAFAGTVAGTGSGTVTVNVTSSFPTGLFSGADTFTVDSQTKVLGNTNLTTGDVVAGGLIASSGQSASSVGSTPLQVLVDFSTATSTSSASASSEQLKRAERRALEVLRHEKAKLGRHHEKSHTGRK